jgi:L-fuculose-phosphate aldolase
MMIAKSQRETVVALCRDLVARGFLAATGGNVALRIDAERFAVTPSAMDYAVMTAADVCILALADLKRVDGDRAPSVESGLHAGVFRKRADCGCSIHTHQPAASACALIGEALTIGDAKLRVILGARVPVVGYAPSGTGWLAGKVAAALRPGVHAYLMLSHGALCCGADPAEATARVAALEAASLAELRRRILSRREPSAGRARVLELIVEAEADLS